MSEISKNKQEIKKLEKDIVNLKKEIDNSNSSDFVEKVAREDLGMVKPREIIYVDKEKSLNNNNLTETN